MNVQRRLILDAAVAGEERVFELEALASGPLFARSLVVSAAQGAGPTSEPPVQGRPPR
jgi:hypothetical protein